MEDWEVYKISIEGQKLMLNGIDIWAHDWKYLDLKPFKAPHPAHPNQMHKYKIWCIEVGNKKAIFAATELSNMVWGFYIPKVAT
ncbi:hypothetical protein ESZ36_22410 [Colwellia demingiae]|uniref:Uncharacterized protein n=1 Tax=Colwellia demingiae TaxID=89401 RepID=A0A5C6Q3N0_9GAMM|nr:hypothetical protein [Colwellia demingiae]TWX63247.1 hypothetical protein ESZ36_22410 [Colwellia demingiae]